MQELKEKLQRLELEMQELKGQSSAVERQQAPPVAPATGQPAPAAQATSDKPAPAARNEEHKNTLDLYGFVMLDSGYDFGQTDPQWFDVERPTKLPAFTNEFGGNGNVYFGVGVPCASTFSGRYENS